MGMEIDKITGLISVFIGVYLWFQNSAFKWEVPA